MKDCLEAKIAANPRRTSPWANQEPGNEALRHLPTDGFARRFLARHKLVMRRSMPLNHGRAILTVDDLVEWQNLIEKSLFEDPELAEAMQDPRGVYNQDETALCPGVDHQRVLSPKGWDGTVYNAGGRQPYPRHRLGYGFCFRRFYQCQTCLQGQAEQV